MVVILKKELERLEKHLNNISDVINGDEDRDGLNLYYEYCTYEHLRLRKLLDELEHEYNEVFDLFTDWFNRKSHQDEEG